MFQLRAPEGLSEISVRGFPVTVLNGIAGVPTLELANELRSHGFKFIEGEDRAVMGSRSTMIERFVNDARYFAEMFSDAKLIAYAKLATGPGAGEGLVAIWTEIERLISSPSALTINGKTDAPRNLKAGIENAFQFDEKIRAAPRGRRGGFPKSKRQKVTMQDGSGLPPVEKMTRNQLFAFLKAHGVAVSLPVKNDQLRAFANEVPNSKPSAEAA
jgi:hypothetical protein